MIGVILAAGVGSRLRPMTNNKPKCLVTTAGKPILQYQIDAYKEAGIDELIIIVGYEGGAIREYCKHIKDIKIQIIENNEPAKIIGREKFKQYRRWGIEPQTFKL